ncbi:MerR family transcriptional regulator [Luteithermobacter gelatinilyticus]|uniref:MerR family transcriptional regulator n=1 Tax=Luteithermobacter gelatinilyticus TaxID=2582913 RepID=UPI001106B72C|nr:helix-turn-helix domain-containing protein [Luteithermobacter gelatinilyticus]
MTTSQKREYTRGKLAKEAGVNLETIRFYEKIGLMPDPPRSAAGYRCYSLEHLKRLKFIRRSRELGFTNNEVAGLLEMVDGTYTCNDIKELALTNIDLIAHKIADLKKMKKSLEIMASQCRGGATPDCAIVDHLFET